MKLDRLLQAISMLAAGGGLEKEITGVTNDSRQCSPGMLFVAIRGLKEDGHTYIEKARQNGAAAFVIQDPSYCSDSYTWILVQDSRCALADLSNAFYQYPSWHMNMIGITGTNGKTTTSNLIAKILEDAGHRVGLVGTIHNRIGDEIVPVHHTTPEAPELQSLFTAFQQKGAEYVVMEVSSHALELHRVQGVEYDVAVFTNLSQDHLDFHGNMENYLAAKGKLFSSLGINAHKERRKFAIFNSDDPFSAILAEMTSMPLITYGIQKKADIRAEEIRIYSRGVQFRLNYIDKSIPVQLKLTGKFNVYNALAAIAVGLVEGVPVEHIIKTLEQIPGIPGRFESVDAGQDFSVIVDYSHTPDSLENCLKTAQEFVQGRIITVFGCGGDRDKSKRPIMGAVAGRLSDFCIITSDNPRSEDPQDIINDILPGITQVTEPYQYLQNR